MSENTTQTGQVIDTVKKALAGIGAKVETAVGELNKQAEAAVGEFQKLQSKGLEQANTVIETATRATQEQIAFAEQLGSEWRKLVLAATRSATGLFTPKA
jgi:hypothetical protein